MSPLIKYKVCWNSTKSNNFLKEHFPYLRKKRPYQRKYSRLSEKLTCAEYQKVYFCRGRNTIKLVTYKYKIVIPQKLHIYVVKWYHMYPLHPLLDITEVINLQHLYWIGIISVVQKEVNNCDTCQYTKLSTKNRVNCLLSQRGNTF